MQTLKLLNVQQWKEIFWYTLYNVQAPPLFKDAKCAFVSLKKVVINKFFNFGVNPALLQLFSSWNWDKDHGKFKKKKSIDLQVLGDN